MATIRKLPSGSWRALVRIKGHRPISGTFRTKAMAERWAIKTEDQIRSGTYRDTQSAESMMLVDHLAWYLASITPFKAASALTRESSRIRVLGEHKALKSCSLATISTETVLKYIDSRKQAGVSNDTIVKELGTLSHAIDAAENLRGIILPRSNPVKQAKESLKFTRALKVSPPRNRRITPEEERLLLESLPPIMREAFVLLIETAMRREELCRARREHLDGNTLRIPETKTSIPRTIPLSERAMEIIRSLPVRDDGFILGVRPDSVTQAFSRACQRLGILDLRPHDLRHEATSRLFERGWSIPEVAAVTGHADWASLKRYTQLRPADLAVKLREHQPQPQHPDSDSD